MINIFIEKYRWYIGTVLILIIIGGAGIIWQNNLKSRLNHQERSQVQDLQQENEQLRSQLSQISSGQVAGEITENQSDKININTADAVTLDKLPNIGPARAADIIAYREENGGFRSIEELKNIKGIGDKTFEEMKDLVTVGE